MTAEAPSLRGRSRATLVEWAAAAAFVLAVYVAVVLGGGVLTGHTDSPSGVLTVVATAMVALGFEPVRRRVRRHLAAATPYDVLAAFSAQVSAAVATEEALPRMARVLAEGTCADAAEVALELADGGTVVARWPADADAVGTAGPGVQVRPVRDGAATIGRLAVRERPNQPLSPVEEMLFSDLAAQAGLALRNVRLTADLQHRAGDLAVRTQELRASRQHIVTASDAARRRLERDIHDGAQQHLVALAVNLRLARTLVERSSPRAPTVLHDLGGVARATLRTLDDLSRGIYPRVLADSGVAAALGAASETSPVPVVVRAATTGRLPPPVEAAVYFACLEAVQNAVKHAAPTRIEVHIEDARDAVTFAVTDDGAGYAPSAVSGGSGIANMRARVESLGGTLRVASSLRAGTTVHGRIPLPGAAEEPE